MTRSFLFFDDVADADPTMGGPSRPQDVQERMTREGREDSGVDSWDSWDSGGILGILGGFWGGFWGVRERPGAAVASKLRMCSSCHEPLEFLTWVASLTIQGQFSVSMTSDSVS